MFKVSCTYDLSTCITLNRHHRAPVLQRYHLSHNLDVSLEDVAAFIVLDDMSKAFKGRDGGVQQLWSLCFSFIYDMYSPVNHMSCVWLLHSVCRVYKHVLHPASHVLSLVRIMVAPSCRPALT